MEGVVGEPRAPKKKGRSGVREGSLLGSPLVDQALSIIPGVDESIERGFATVRDRGFTEADARTDFGKWMVAAHRAVAEAHRKAEAEALKKLVDLLLADAGTLPSADSDIREWITAFLRKAAPDFVAFEFRSGQSRKSRAGSVWEKIGEMFLEWNGIPCEKPTGESARRLRQIDKVVPSVQVALTTPDKSIRLSFKTEAREKWRVLIDESRRGYVYLVTLGDDITPDRLVEMADSRLVVYVPREVKEKRPEFKDNPAIRVLDALPVDLRPFVPSRPDKPADLMIPTGTVPDRRPKS